MSARHAALSVVAVVVILVGAAYASASAFPMWTAPASVAVTPEDDVEKPVPTRKVQAVYPAEAKEKKIPYELTTYGIGDLDRAIADGEAHGLVKVLTKPGTDRILGATIAGEHAGDLLAEFVLAMRHGIGLNKILGTIHTYPTMAEANKYVAGNWKRARVTQGQMAFASAFHAWTRGESGFAGVLGKLGALGDKRPYYEAPDARLGT
jgi:hypothetical protein